MSTFSHSEVDLRNKCHRAWFYGYSMEIESVEQAKPLRRGILGHEGLQVYFNALKDMNPNAKELARDHVIALTNQYPERYATSLAEVLRAYEFFFEASPFWGWEILEVEKTYMLRINDDLEVPVIVDLIAQDRFGDIWVIDNKFMYDFPNGVESEILPQLPLYMGIARANGIDVSKAGYSVLRTRNLNTPTAATMYQFIRVEITQERIDRNFIEHALVSARIFEDKQKPIEVQSYEAIRTKQPKVCGMCDFSTICLAELNGHQPELVLQSYYQAKKRRSFEGVTK